MFFFFFKKKAGSHLNRIGKRLAKALHKTMFSSSVLGKVEDLPGFSPQRGVQDIGFPAPQEPFNIYFFIK